jgi:[acyl-carrier-protein] S-malonyltransferase
VTGVIIPEAKFISHELHAQITQPVRWLDGVLEMVQQGVNNVIEFGPGRVLTGAAKRTNRDLILRNIGKSEDFISS